MTKKKPKVSPATPINREAAAAARASFRENFPEADAELFPSTSPPTSPDGDKLTRARGPNLSVFKTWCERIASGKTERFAAIGLGYPYPTIRAWANDRQPCPECPGAGCEVCGGGGTVKGPLGEMLADAHETEIQHLLDRPHDSAMAIGTSEDDGLHPKAAELLSRDAYWKLEKKDWKRFGQRNRVETTGAEGGPVRQEIAFTVAELREIAKGTTE